MSYTNNTQKNHTEYIKNNHFVLITFNADGSRNSTRGNINALQLLHDITYYMQSGKRMLVFPSDFSYKKLFYANSTNMNDSARDIEFYNKCLPYSITTTNFM